MNDILDFAKRILGFNQEQPASPEAELLLKQVEAERAGTPMPGSVAYERQQQTLPTPSQYDVIQPSPPQGPRDYTDYAAAWLADKIQDPNLSPSDRAAATRRLQEAFALPADLLGLQSAYNAGQQGALGNYGTALVEGAMAGLPVAAEARPLVREAMTAVRARPVIEDVVGAARKELAVPSMVSAEGPVIARPTVLDDPSLSISERRQAAQGRIKDLRAQLNTLQQGTPEHEALKAQIAEEGARLGQLRGPAQEAVVKEAPPVEIKSRSPTGLYSEAEEIARRLPQADTPENLIKAILNKGVKDAELIDARVMNKDRTPTPEFTEYLASRGSQQPISDAVGDYVATNLPTLQKRVLKGHEAVYIDSPTLKEHPDGGSDYRELLFHYPGSGYEGGHWRTIQPDTAMHARVENTPDSLFVHEMQADQAQQGRQMGFRDPSAATALERVRDEFNAVKDRLKVAENEYYKIDNALKTSLMQGIADSSVKSVPKEVQDAFSARAYKRPEGEFDEVMKTIPSGQDANSVLYQRLLDAKNHYTDLFADYQRLSNEFTDALNNVAASSPIPLSPHMEDTGAWTRAMAKELLTEAVDSGKGKIEISGGSVQNFRANEPGTAPEHFTDHSHYYNTIVPSEFKAVLKELDPSADMDKVVRVRKVKPTDTEVENDPAYQQLREMTRDMAEQIQKYPDQGEIDALKTFHGDDWAEQAEITKDEMREELAGHQETLMQFFDRRDRVEINLTPKMIEAIKGKKLKKYFQGGRVE